MKRIKMLQNYRAIYDSPLMLKGNIYDIDSVNKILKRLERLGRKRTADNLVSEKIAVYVDDAGNKITGLQELNRKARVQKAEAELVIKNARNLINDNTELPVNIEKKDGINHDDILNSIPKRRKKAD